MKLTPFIALILICCSLSGLRAAGTYTNFIRQVQLSWGVEWDASVLASGEQVSPLPINDGGGTNFELWTVMDTAPFTSYLLDSKYVGPWAPAAAIVIRSEDPYEAIPRTRADRPFSVEFAIDGLRWGEYAPPMIQGVKLLRHVQPYGADGIGEDLDRTQATLFSQALLTDNGKQTLAYTMTSIPSGDLSKVRGEERFSIFTLTDSDFPVAHQLASRYVQIWPVADGSISGISQNQKFRTKLPDLTLTYHDLYPESRTYMQVYYGGPKLGTTGTIVPGTSLVLNGSVPENRTLVLDRYESVFDRDGRWTMELLTVTPFGTDRLACVSFDIDRTIHLNGTFATME